MVSAIRTGRGRDFFSKSGTGIAEERHQNRRACTDVPLLAERNSKYPDRPYGFAKYRQSGLDIYAWHGMYFFPRFPFIDIDRIRWVCAGLKAFKHYIRENGLPDLIHAHCMNYAGILAFKISQNTASPMSSRNTAAPLRAVWCARTNGSL